MYKKTLIVFSLAFFGLLMWGVSPTKAEASCQMTGATFSVNGTPPGLLGATWYDPFVSKVIDMSIQVNDCAGKTLEIQLKNKPRSNPATTLHSFQTSVPNSSTGNGTLQYSFVPGETACDRAVGPVTGLDCYLYIYGTVDGSVTGGGFDTYVVPGSLSVSGPNGTLSYDCFGTFCNDDFNGGSPWPAFVPPTWTGGGGTTATTTLGRDFSRLANPIQYDNIPDVIRQLIKIVFVIGIPLVALAIIYAGFMLVTAGGNQDKIKKGKQALLAAVIGGAILLGAWVIAEAIGGTVDQIRGV